MKVEDQNKYILSNLGIENLNDMQKATQFAIIKEQNVMLLSPTGSGKTLAVLLPVLQLLDENIAKVQCLIVVPSRELALQIEQVWKKLGTKFKVNVCYGGHPIDTELKNLSTPPALLVGTPGRLTDHLERNSFETNFIKILVLDEFDKSLQLGFHDEMGTIISQIPANLKKVLLSATSEVEIPSFLEMKSSVTLDFLEEEINETLTIKLVESPEKDKINSLFHLICSLDSEPALIFCNHRESTERISDLLNGKGVQTGYYHGAMDQADRERVLIKFKNGSLNYLVTTDLAARGLDIPEMNHVIHYHLPGTYTEFVHRNGRTARMHASGTAYIIQSKDENIPDYIPDNLDILQIPMGKPLPDNPKYETIYVSGGNKNKLNKGDIVGFFLKKGKLEKSDLGLIEVKDFISFIAVRAAVVKKLLANIKDEKMKGKKYKIEVAKIMQKLISYPLSTIYYLLFGSTLVIFHVVQWVCYNLFGYEAHKKSVDALFFFLVLNTAVLGTRYKFSGLEKLPANTPLIIAANHQSWYDITTLGWFMRKVHPKFVSKIELGKGIPSISYSLRHGGSVLIDRKNAKQALAAIKEMGKYIEFYKRSVIIFPEGTRSKTGKPRPFAENGLKILCKYSPSALVVPVTINNAWKMTRWGSFPLGIGNTFEFTVHDLISVKDTPFQELFEKTERLITQDIR